MHTFCVASIFCSASSIELGKVQVSIEIAFKLAEVLEVRLSEIWREIEGEAG